MQFNKLFKLISVLCLVMVFASVPMVAGAASADHAQVSYQEDVPASPLSDFVNTAKNLAGVALLFSALINVGKKFNIVKDGQVPAYNLAFQSVSVAVLIYLQFTGKADLVPVIDEKAGVAANFLTGALALIYQLFASRIIHENVLAGLPLIGKSHSDRKAGDGPLIETFETVSPVEASGSVGPGLYDR